MKDVKLFPNQNMEFDEYLKNIQELLTTTKVVSCGINMTTGMKSMLTIDDLEKRQKLIDASLMLDREKLTNNTLDNKKFKKLPVIMTLANIIANHYERVDDLNIEQLVLLGHFSSCVDESYMAEHLGVVANKELLQTALEKTDDFYERMDVLEAVMEDYLHSGIDKNDEEALNNFKNASIIMIKNTPIEEIIAKVSTTEDLFEELSKKGIRI
ncbi:MAG: hypothetical protein IJO43_01765 [Bacilli bacterium]|nr:hypothetical protein [Bacilli bacterium]